MLRWQKFLNLVVVPALFAGVLLRVPMAPAAQPVNSNGKWKDNLNWSEGTVPANAVIDANKKVTLDLGDAFNVQTLEITLNGNGLDGAGKLTLTGLGSRWLNGPLAGVGGVGELVITSSADLEMAGGPKTLTSWLLTNQGAITWTNGSFITGNGALIANSGTFTTNFDGTLSYNGTPARTIFTNSGTFSKTGGSGTTEIQATFNNSGNVTVSSGTVLFSGGGTSGGTVSLTAAGAKLRLATNNYEFTDGAVLNGPGAVEVAGAVTTFSGNITGNASLSITAGTATVNGNTSLGGTGSFTGGTLNGTGNLSLGGLLTLDGTTLSGAGIVNANGGASLVDNFSINASRTLNLAGASTWSGGTIYGGGGSVVNVKSGATLANSADTTLSGTHYGSGNLTTVLNIAGTFAKTAGAGSGRTDLLAVVNNTGLIDVQAGRLDLSGGGTHSATAQIASGATLELSGGTHEFNSGAAVTGGGTLHLSTGNLTVNAAVTSAAGGNFTGGTLNGAGTLTFTGPLTLAGTTLAGTGTLIANGGASLTSNFSINGTRTLTLGSNATWSAGNVYAGGGAVMNIQPGKVFAATADTYFYGGYWGGTTAVINNAGTFTRSTSAGTATVDAVFNNSGTLTVQTGTLDLGAGGTHTGTANITSGATLALTGGNHTFQSGARIEGTGTVRIGDGNVVFTGNNTGTAGFAISGGTATFEGATVTAGSGNFTGGTLAGSGTLTLGGASAFAGTIFTGTGTLVSNGGATVSGSVYTQGGRTLTLGGTTAWNAGAFYAGNSTLNIPTGATFSTNFNGNIYGTYYGSGNLTTVLNVAGTFAKTGGTAGGRTDITAIVNNTGLIDVQAGVLDLSNGGTFSAPAQIAAGAFLELSGGTHVFNAGTAVNGSGTLALSGGNLTVNAPVTSAAGGNFTGGTLNGTGNLTFTGPLALAGTTLTGAGTLAANAGATISNYLHFNGTRTLALSGNSTWSGGTIYGGGGSVLSVASGAVLNVTGDGTLYGAHHSGAVTVLDNRGTVTRSGSSGTATIDAVFNNSGTLNVQTGVLDLGAGGTHTGTANLTAGATLALTGGTHTFESGSSLGGSGTLRIAGGNVALNATVSAVGSGNFTGGNLTGPGNLTFSGPLSIAGWVELKGSGTLTANGGAAVTSSFGIRDGQKLVLAGNSTWNNSTIYHGSGAVIDNVGTLANTADSYLYHYYDPSNDATVLTFNNSGTFTKSGGTGTTTFDAKLVNTGTVNVQTGTLQLGHGGSSSGPIAVSANATLTITDGFTVSDAAQLTGAGTLRLTGGTLALTGQPGIATFTQTGGTLTGNQTFAQTVTWSGGDWNSATAGATTTIASGGKLVVQNSGGKIDRRSITVANGGTVEWESGHWEGGNGSVFTNNGAFLDKNVYGYRIKNPGLGGTFRFDNNGTYTRSTGGTTAFDVAFNNTGTVNIDAGNIELDGGGTMSATSIVNAAAGTRLYFDSDYRLSDGARLQGSGAFVQRDGTLDIAGALQASSFNWTGGDWNATAATLTTIAGGTTLTIDGSGNKDFDYRSITVAPGGTVEWQAGYLRGGHGSVFTNEGTFRDKNVYGYTVIAGTSVNGLGGAFTFVNKGSYIRDVSGTTYFTAPFNNQGTVTLSNGGRIELDGGGTMAATSVVNAAAGTFVYFDSSYTLLSGAQLTGAGSFVQRGGTLTVDGTLKASSLTWSNGDWNAATAGLTTTLASGTTVTIAGSGNMDFNRRTIDIASGATLVWESGHLRSGNGGAIVNNGTFEDKNVSGYDILSPTASGGYGGTFTFTNAGTYKKTTTGTTNINIPFTNTGTLEITAGSVVFGAALTNTGGITLANNATANFSAPLTVNQPLTGSGTITAPAVTATGQVAPGSSPGKLTLTGTLTLLGTSSLLIELGGPGQGTDYDFLSVGGTAAIAGDLKLSFLNGYQNSVPANATFTILSSAGLTGAFANVANGGTLLTTDGAGFFTVNYGSGLAQNSVVLSNFVAVPEPSTYALLALGLGFVIWQVRRRRA